MPNVTDEFVAGPPAIFARDNLIIPAHTAAKSGELHLKIMRGQGNCANKNNKVCYFVESSDPTEPRIKVVWCGYAKNKQKVAMIGSKVASPGYFFTFEMDGCTIGLGSRGPDGTLMVSHCNMVGAAEKAFSTGGKEASRPVQRGAQIAALGGLFGQGNFSYIGPSHYQDVGGDSDFHSTTFGIREDTGRWRMHTLSFKKVGKDYFHGGLKRSGSTF